MAVPFTIYGIIYLLGVNEKDSSASLFNST